MVQFTRVFKCTPEFNIDSIAIILKSAKPIKLQAVPEIGDLIPLHPALEDIKVDDDAKGAFC